MIKVLDYTPGDAQKLPPLKKYFDGETDIRDKVEKLIHDKNAIIKSIFDENGIIAIIGICILWAGHAEIFSLTTDRIAKHPIGYTKTVITLLDRAQELFSINRFQGYCLSGNSELQKWFKVIGFEQEALMRKWGPSGLDYYLYARVL